MKRIKYRFLSSEVNYGTEEAPDIRQNFIPKDFPYSEEAYEAAKAEAYEEPEIYDDGKPEPVVLPTAEERLEALEAAILEMLGVGL